MSWKLPRPLARKIAEALGYFFLPCPSCGEETAGFEWHDVDGHQSSIPYLPWSGRAKGICPDCTRAGVGCRAFAAVGALPYHDCEFLRDGAA